MKDLIPVAFSHTDILDTVDDELFYSYCEHIYKQEDCSSVEDMMSSLVALEQFPDVTFCNLLSQYLEEKGKDIEGTVRGYYPYKKGFLMTHGGNYDWLDADLLGGTGNGYTYKDFENWLEQNGYYLERY